MRGINKQKTNRWIIFLLISSPAAGFLRIMMPWTLLSLSLLYESMPVNCWVIWITKCSTRWKRTLAHLRIGRFRFTLCYLLAGEPQASRNNCLVPLTGVHFLVECLSLGNSRLRFLAEHRLSNGSYSLASLLGQESSRWESDLYLFLGAGRFLYS